MKDTNEVEICKDAEDECDRKKISIGGHGGGVPLTPHRPKHKGRKRIIEKHVRAKFTLSLLDPRRTPRGATNEQKVLIMILYPS